MPPYLPLAETGSALPVTPHLVIGGIRRHRVRKAAWPTATAYITLQRDGYCTATAHITLQRDGYCTATAHITLQRDGYYTLTALHHAPA